MTLRHYDRVRWIQMWWRKSMGKREIVIARGDKGDKLRPRQDGGMLDV